VTSVPHIQIGGGLDPASSRPTPSWIRRSGTKWVLRFVAIGYLAVLVMLPVGIVFWRTFENGLQPVIDALTSEAAVHAFKVTAIVAGLAVIINTIFGVGGAILLVRHRFPGRRVLDALIDLPIAVSPVVVGLALVLVYGRNSSVGGWFVDHGFPIIYSIPGMVLATVFVSLPLVIRAVQPVLQEMGDEQEQAAATLGANAWQRFSRVTLPSIRGALAYGVVLAFARALGEFGAVAVVSGHIVGETQTATLLVQESFQNFQQVTAYAVAAALVLTAIVSIVVSRFLRPKGSAQ
jgi:sulfate transport system permease protein